MTILSETRSSDVRDETADERRDEVLVCARAQARATRSVFRREHDRQDTGRHGRIPRRLGAKGELTIGGVIDPMQAGSAMPLFRQTPRRTLNGELVVRLLPQDFCHCQR